MCPENYCESYEKTARKRLNQRLPKTRICENCGKVINVRGYSAHRRSVACQNYQFFKNNPWVTPLILILIFGIGIFAAIHGNGWK